MADDQSFGVKAIYAINPRVFFSRMAGGLTHGLREFVWLGLAFVYPVWVVGVLATLVLYWVLVAGLWLLFVPLRLYMRATHQGNYARAEQ
jgi:hypothetical protein